MDSVASNKISNWAGFLSTLGLFDVFHSLWFIIVGALLILIIISCNINCWSSLRRLFRGSAINTNGDFYTPDDSCVEISTGILPVAVAAAVTEKALKAKRYRVQTRETRDTRYFAAVRNSIFCPGTYASHLSLIIFILAFITGNHFGFTNSAFTVPENGIREVGHDTNLSLELVSFTDEYYQEGMTKDFRSDVILYENGNVVATDIIRVDHPLIYNGIRFYQSYYGPAVNFSIQDKHGNEIFNGGYGEKQREDVSKMLASGKHNVGGSGEIESGAGGIRTPYLLTASQTFSQVNYGPVQCLPNLS